MAANDDAPGAPGGPPAGGDWLTIAAAARRLGINPRSVRGRIARGTLVWKPNGNAGKLVLVPPAGGPGGGPAGAPGDDPDAAPAGGPAGGPAGEAFEVELLRGELTEALVAAARAEAQLGAKDELIVELKTMLAEARRPWWRRLIG
jgi:hypothetical protein